MIFSISINIHERHLFRFGGRYDAEKRLVKSFFILRNKQIKVSSNTIVCVYLFISFIAYHRTSCSFYLKHPLAMPYLKFVVIKCRYFYLLFIFSYLMKKNYRKLRIFISILNHRKKLLMCTKTFFILF
jgi:hypothetical protein